MRPALLVLALPLALGALAFSPLEAVSGAKGHVAYVGGYLRDPALAQGLLAALNRGVLVELYTSAYTYLDGRSYFLGLYLAGARLYLGKVPRYYLVVDQVPAAWGSREGTWERVPPEMAARAEAELREVRRAALPFLYPPELLARALLDRKRR